MRYNVRGKAKNMIVQSKYLYECSEDIQGCSHEFTQARVFDLKLKTEVITIHFPLRNSLTTLFLVLCGNFVISGEHGHNYSTLSIKNVGKPRWWYSFNYATNINNVVYG